MENTVGDFWRMIWENRSAVIVLFCDPKRDEKVKNYILQNVNIQVHELLFLIGFYAILA